MSRGIHKNFWTPAAGAGLFTDFYQLTMMAGYLREGRAEQRACFDYFYRTPPPDSAFVVTAGLEPFLEFLEQLCFTEEDIEYLRSLGRFEEPFFDYLRRFRPQCKLRAMPEGTLAFPYEPIVSVEGPLFELQLIETALLNFLNFQSLIATKAARVCFAAQGDPVMEFGLRRAHGPDGGLSASRAAYLGGCSSTSNVLAGKLFGIPVSGTNAHSWVMSYDSELEAFHAFVRLYPESCTLLVDTYDTLGSGVPNAIRAFEELRAQGHLVRPAIRLDSGDLASLSQAAWQMLCEAGFEDAVIVGSNDLDEHAIAELKASGAKINAWGVGTHLVTAYDAPALGGVYKLSAIQTNEGWTPRMKYTASTAKTTDPGCKQVTRHCDGQGQPLYDVIQGVDDSLDEEMLRDRSKPDRLVKPESSAISTPLLRVQFESGKRAGAPISLQDTRQYVAQQLEALAMRLRELRDPAPYPVYLSDDLGELKAAMLRARHRRDKPPTDMGNHS